MEPESLLTRLKRTETLITIASIAGGTALVLSGKVQTPEQAVTVVGTALTVASYVLGRSIHKASVDKGLAAQAYIVDTAVEQVAKAALPAQQAAEVTKVADTAAQVVAATAADATSTTTGAAQ